jgi:hypothetical protein
VKAAVETVLVRGGAAKLARHFHRDRTLVLAYHNIVPHGDPVAGDCSLHLPQRQFAAQLDLLVELCDVIPLDSALERNGRGKRPRVAITFDDAYRGTVTAGVSELVSRGLPATIFVVPAFVGGGAFWWDDVLPLVRADPATTTAPAYRHRYRGAAGRSQRTEGHHAGISHLEPPQSDTPGS